ncbi:TPA: type 4a pilus biogenesis protein PilO [Candidatus Dojkabacteria bacterium]|uniref:Type 4a pilus biogenesis protein PilO n=1 Tax=Candidatus Dojkabacteria bacterium TaxID=2099670 RepID=A0A832QGN1_9BACT|nr:type 4a pilus biogenesis protein PilO [Candidatus Dojkabacteria bacterium]
MAQQRKSVGLLTTIRESAEKRNSYASFAVSLLISIVLIVFAVKPTISTIIQIRQGVKEKTRVNQQIQGRIDAISKLDAQIQEEQEKFEALEMIFPSEREYILLLANIDAVIARNGFTLMSVGFDNHDNENYKLTTPILTPSVLRLNVSGKYSSFINLLKDLESLPMCAVVENISFSTQKDEKSNSYFSLSLRVYSIEQANFYKQ